MLRLLGVLLGIGMTAWGQTPPDLRLERFQAFLFNAKTGGFSADVLGDSKPELGNVPIGALASEATLVTVKVHVGRSGVPKALRVHLVAVESGSTKFEAQKTPAKNRVIVDRSEPLGPANAEGFTYVGFWLPGTGCREIRLKAELTGGRGGPAITEVIPFVCYE